jgi:hypothetical protein
MEAHPSTTSPSLNVDDLPYGPYGDYPSYDDYPHYDQEVFLGMPTGLVSSFNCQNPEHLIEETCVVEYVEYIGDGWCDWNLGSDDWFGSSRHHNVEVCGYDGGDCCQTTCQGSLCGQNGYHCQDPNATTTASLYPGDEYGYLPENPDNPYPSVGESDEYTSDDSSSAPPTSPSVMTAESSPAVRVRELTDSGSQKLYAALENIVDNACADEMARCFEDESGSCGRLFMVGSASLASDTLQDLLRCIREFDGNSVLEAMVLLDGMDGEHGECIAQNCRAEYMQCHVSMDCFLGTGTNALRQQLDECAASFCTFTPMPTASPTLRPTAADGDAAIGFIIEANGKQFKIEHKQITAGNLGTIPFGTPLEGAILVTTSCDPSNGGSVELIGMIVIIKRGLCNVHDTARIAFEGGAHLVAFADDAFANSMWLPRDKHLDLPVLSVKYDDASAIQTMQRRGSGMVRGRLSSASYCDTMHAGGVDIASLAPSPSGLSCCAAGDIVISFLLYSHDFWNYGVRGYPFCSGSEHHCLNPWDVFSEEEPEVCGHLCKRNGVCEDGGEGSLGHACGWGGDCQDCGQRNRNDLAAVEWKVAPTLAFPMGCPQSRSTKTPSPLCAARSGEEVVKVPCWKSTPSFTGKTACTLPSSILYAWKLNVLLLGAFCTTVCRRIQTRILVLPHKFLLHTSCTPSLVWKTFRHLVASVPQA